MKNFLLLFVILFNTTFCQLAEAAGVPDFSMAVTIRPPCSWRAERVDGFCTGTAICGGYCPTGSECGTRRINLEGMNPLPVCGCFPILNATLSPVNLDDDSSETE